MLSDYELIITDRTLKFRMDRHVARTTNSNDCWEWQRYRLPAGYGMIGVGGRKGRLFLSHRVAFMLATGTSIESSQLVLHDCGNPPCCNPNHLHLGDKRLNAKEAVDRGLLIPRKGERALSAKLTEAQVLEIRADPAPHRVLAKKYGVGKTIIGSIKNRKKWKHL